MFWVTWTAAQYLFLEISWPKNAYLHKLYRTLFTTVCMALKFSGRLPQKWPIMPSVKQSIRAPLLSYSNISICKYMGNWLMPKTQRLLKNSDFICPLKKNLWTLKKIRFKVVEWCQWTYSSASSYQLVRWKIRKQFSAAQRGQDFVNRYVRLA
jgi:hypothetical protein